jgi:hypothetical protein
MAHEKPTNLNYMCALNDFHNIHDTDPFIALVTRRMMPYIPQYSCWLSFNILISMLPFKLHIKGLNRQTRHKTSLRLMKYIINLNSLDMWLAGQSGCAREYRNKSLEHPRSHLPSSSNVTRIFILSS